MGTSPSRRPTPPLPPDLELAAAYDAASPGGPTSAPGLRAVALLASRRATDVACNAVVPLVLAAKQALDEMQATGTPGKVALHDAIELVEALLTGPIRPSGETPVPGPFDPMKHGADGCGHSSCKTDCGLGR